VIKLTENKDPRWITVAPGVRLKVRAADASLVILARLKAAEAISGRELNLETQAAARVEMARAFAQLSIIEWEGVGDENGEEVEPTPARIDQLMALMPIFDAFDQVYVRPTEVLIEEKNA
jgi:hypothetical protein